MFSRSVHFVAFALLGFCSYAMAQRSPGERQPSINLTVKVVFENDHPAGLQLRVQLLTSTGLPVSDGFTNNEGEVRFPNTQPGDYRLRVFGNSKIDESNSDGSFRIDPRESLHTEYIRVHTLPDNTQTGAPQGTVSAYEFNIPASARKEFDKGIAAMKKDDPNGAKKRFEKAVEMYPKYASAYNNLGIIAMRSGEAAKGEQYFRTALEIDPQYPSVCLNLAKIDFTKKNFPEAEEFLARALARDASDPLAWTLLSQAQLINGKIDLAIASARRVHEMPQNQGLSIAHLVAAQGFESKNQRADALAEYKAFVAETPNGATADKVRSKIKTLQKQIQ